MAAIAGPAKTISISGREFRVVGDADIGRQLGGFTKERLPNGDGSSRQRMTPIPWALTGISVEVDNDNEDQEFLEAVKDSPDDVPIVITYSDDSSYSGLGSIDGELSYSNNNAAASFDLKGSGKLKKL